MSSEIIISGKLRRGFVGGRPSRAQLPDVREFHRALGSHSLMGSLLGSPVESPQSATRATRALLQHYFPLEELVDLGDSTALDQIEERQDTTAHRHWYHRNIDGYHPYDVIVAGDRAVLPIYAYRLGGREYRTTYTELVRKFLGRTIGEGPWEVPLYPELLRHHQRSTVRALHDTGVQRLASRKRKPDEDLDADYFGELLEEEEHMADDLSKRMRIDNPSTVRL